MKPMIELSGVRSSWDMVARNADLIRSADSAASLARTSSRSATFSSVMSLPTQSEPINRPSASRTGRFVQAIQTRSPLRRMFSFSLRVWRSGCRTISAISAARSRPLLSVSGTMVPTTLRPRISLLLVAEEPLGELVEEGDAPLGVHAQDDAVGVLDQFPVLRFTGAKRLLNLDPFGDFLLQLRCALSDSLFELLRMLLDLLVQESAFVAGTERQDSVRHSSCPAPREGPLHRHQKLQSRQRR